MADSRPFDFGSDNGTGVDPRILSAIIECNQGYTSPYGQDELSRAVNDLYSEVFQREAYVFATPTGTAANGLALGALTPPYGSIFCHEQAHIVTTECGAPEFFSGGARLVLLAGQSHKITSAALLTALEPLQMGNLHQLRPSALSLTQATEGGTIYDHEELAVLCRLAHDTQMKVHMDGARFANAMVQLGVTPAEITWKAGIDTLSLGLTKNGAMGVEAVVCFDRRLAEVLRYMHKRAGFLFSKMRFAAAQLRAYVSGNLWIENARKANGNARRLAAALIACRGVALEELVQANEVFAHLPTAVTQRLAADGFRLRPWPHPRGDMYRLVGAFNQSEELISRFERVLG